MQGFSLPDSLLYLSFTCTYLVFKSDFKSAVRTLDEEAIVKRFDCSDNEPLRHPLAPVGEFK